MQHSGVRMRGINFLILKLYFRQLVKAASPRYGYGLADGGRVSDLKSNSSWRFQNFFHAIVSNRMKGHAGYANTA